MNKYIINNCPIFETDYSCGEGLDRCSTCTDCTMKQIVELCNKIIFLNSGTDFTDVDMYKHAIGENFVAKKILQLLDIQEITDEL